MRSTKHLPKGIQPYVFHGVDLDIDQKQAVGDCPFCGGQGKFSVEVATSRFRCWTCPRRGNARTFMRQLWEYSDENTNDYTELAKDRGLQPETVLYWQISKSVITSNWLVPAFNVQGVLDQVYRYVQPEGDRRRLLPTPTFGHQLFRSSVYDVQKPTVYLCEGPWDAMALWESLGKSGREEASVLTVPGCMVFFEAWLPLFRGKVVNLMYDNDHPRKHSKTGRLIAPAGLLGMKRVAKMLNGTAAEINYLAWGGIEVDHASRLPDGYDVRDVLQMPVGHQDDEVGVGEALEGLLAKLYPVPKEWLKRQARATTEASSNEGGLVCTPCTNYRDLVFAWRKALRWTKGLDRALAVMLASITSTKVLGDQLWIKVIGPAGCGKSTLCEAISVNQDYIFAKSTIRGFHSGFRSDNNSNEDNSLVSLLYDKTLVTKDGDTLLQSPNLSQILSEARDIYDSTSRTHYRNATSRNYTGIRMTWLLCGTSSLRAIDNSELGERFLDCVIMDHIDNSLEDEILWRVANRSDRNVNVESDGSPKSQYDPELVVAMQLTGGYITYLRENAAQVLPTIENSVWAKRQCTYLGKFVAYMRARPSRLHDEDTERELAARLVSQHVRLAKCLAMVLNHAEVDKDIISLVSQVSMDTSRGQTLDIVRYLYTLSSSKQRLSTEVRAISLHTSQSDEKTKTMLRFLKRIGVVEPVVVKSKGGLSNRPRWCLTEQLHKLYAVVTGESEDA